MPAPAGGIGAAAPRVAYFPDTYHEVNGVARTAREFTAYAVRKRLPLLCVRPGGQLRSDLRETVESLELPRGRASVRVEQDLWQDLAIWRFLPAVRRTLARFEPDIVHITSMGDFGMLGWRLSRQLGVPLVAAWHTNVHEYAACRFARAARLLPERPRQAIADGVGRLVLAASLRFYRAGAVTLAPTRELVDLVRTGTRRPAFLMERGVDTALFRPERRMRSGGPVVFGYVGRLSTEKNLRLLQAVEEALLAEGLKDYRFEIVGHGPEERWLREHLKRANLRGVLLGERLARAYADMDVFLFPSRTDTYGNVVWESAASGVPSIVTGSGGPRWIVRDGETGLVSRSDGEFVRNALALYRDRNRRERMGALGRKAALEQSWNAVFDGLYKQAYATALAGWRPPARKVTRSSGRSPDRPPRSRRVRRSA